MAPSIFRISNPRAGRKSGPVRRLLNRIENQLRYVAASLFGLVFFIFLVGIPSLLIFTSTYGLGDGVRERAEKLLGGNFYTVSIERVLFSPTRGFILSHLEIRDRTPSRRLLVSANRLAVSVNMNSVLRHQPSLERIFLRDATLDIPLGEGEEPRLRLDHVRGLILCPAEQFHLTFASFEVAGINVRVSGTFLNPKKFAPKPVSTAGPGETAKTINAIQKELLSIQWKGVKPTLTIRAGGDLADTESLKVERAELRAGEGLWKGVGFRQVQLDLSYAARKLNLQKFLIEDGSGIFQAAGIDDFAAKTAVLEFAGSFDSSPIPGLFLSSEKASEWSFADPVHLSGNLSADLNGTKPKIEGVAQLQSGRFTYRGISMDSLSFGAALHEGKILVRDLHATGEPGSVDADLMMAPQDNRIRLRASLYPAKFAPATGDKTAEALTSMNFKDPLMISFEGGAPALDPMQLKGEGTLSLGKAAMRGSWIDSLNARVLLSDGAADFRDIVVKIDKGTGKGEFIYDFKNWEGRFPSVRSTLDPIRLMTWIDPNIAHSLKDYRFNTPPDVRLSGKVGLKDPEKNDLHIIMNAPDGLGYTLIKKNLPFGATSGKIDLKGQKLAIDIPQSQLFGGQVALKADVSVAPGDGRFGASVHLEDVDFKTVAQTYFDYTESSGKLTGDYSFRMVGGNERSMTGSGRLLIKDGNVLAMPILGPLSVLLNEVIPGFGYQPARKATADFAVRDGVISTRNILIEGLGFNMIGHGDINYLDNQMDMSMRLNIKGPIGLVTYLVSKTFEYESVGSASHPKWRPKILPKLGPKQTPSPQPSPSSSP
jgi:hypothetical protein